MSDAYRTGSPLRWLIALHWLTVVLIAAVFAFSEFRGIFPRGSSERSMMMTLHAQLGLTVLVLLVLRLVLRARARLPAVSPPLPNWQIVLSRIVHAALYLWMLVMPLAGWALRSAEGVAVSLWGIPLPPLVAESHALAEALEEFHETAGTFGYFLIGIHAGAALLHHYLWHDDTLRRMALRRS